MCAGDTHKGDTESGPLRSSRFHGGKEQVRNVKTHVYCTSQVLARPDTSQELVYLTLNTILLPILQMRKLRYREVK